MAKTVLLASLFACACALAPAAAAAPCSTDTLANFDSAYDGTEGCSVGTLSFSDFLVEPAPGPSGIVQVSPSTITLTPIAGGFDLSAISPLAAAAGETFGLRFGFRLTPPSPQALAGTLALGLSTVEPDGAITAIAFNGASGLATVFDIGVDADASEPLVLPLASFFDVFVEIVVDAGTAGSASLGPSLGRITFATDGGSTVPEPGTLALVALALLTPALALPARRGRQRRS